MDAFVKLAPLDRRAFFETAADKVGIVPTIVVGCNESLSES